MFAVVCTRDFPSRGAAYGWIDQDKEQTHAPWQWWPLWPQRLGPQWWPGSRRLRL